MAIDGTTSMQPSGLGVIASDRFSQLLLHQAALWIIAGSAGRACRRSTPVPDASDLLRVVPPDLLLRQLPHRRRSGRAGANLQLGALEAVAGFDIAATVARLLDAAADGRA
jgi:hypothetical protein